MTVDDEPTDAGRVKSSLRRLAGPDGRQIIEEAAGAIDDLEAAARFVETVGLAELELAVEAADDPGLTSRGRRAIEAFRRFQRAAAGGEPTNHFHPGRGTDLRGDDEGPSR